MKLTSAQVHQVLDQFEGEVIPSDSPSVPELEATFGPHTFFVATEGLHLVERSEATNSTRRRACCRSIRRSWSPSTSAPTGGPIRLRRSGAMPYGDAGGGFGTSWDGRLNERAGTARLGRTSCVDRG